jgi:GH24 family phage-related lysozyme (muramidase)
MKQIPALFKKSSDEAQKPQPSEETKASSTKMTAALLGGVYKSMPENTSTETADNVTGKTKTVTGKSNRARKASGVKQNKDAAILGDIYKLMQEDREDFVKHKEELKSKKQDFDSEEEKQHKEILKALGADSKGDSRGDSKGDSGGEGTGKSKKSGKKRKDKDSDTSRFELLGKVLGAAGLATAIGASKLFGPKKEEPKAPAPNSPPPKSENPPTTPAAKPSTESTPAPKLAAPPSPKTSAAPTATPASRGPEPARSVPSASASAKKQDTESVPTPSGDAYDIAKPMIERHEGRRNRPYKDSKGLWTVGVGHLIGDGKTLPPEMNRDFSDKEVDDIFAKDYEHHEKAAKRIPGYEKVSGPGQASLIDLTFNMGPSWYKKWPTFTEQIKNGDIEGASSNLEGSAWYKQVGRRGPDVVNTLRSGKSASAEPAGGNKTWAKPVSPPPSAVPTESKPATASGGDGAKTWAKPTSPMPAGQPSDLASATQVQSGVEIKGIQPTLAGRVAAAAADFKAKTGKKLMITSGFRSNEKQKQLFDAKLAENGGNVAATRKMVAEPASPLGNGRGSQHMIGLAIDINSKGESGLNVLAGPRTKPTGWLESFGLTRPVNNEDWHVQLAGSPATPDNPDKPGDPVIVPSKDGVANPATGEKKPEPKAVAAAEGKSYARPIVATPRATPAPPPPPTSGNQIASTSTQNKNMKEEMAEKAKVTNIVNNTVSSSSSPEPESVIGEPENDEPSYLRKVLYG